MTSTAHKFPEAFDRGQRDCARHEARTDGSGDWPKDKYPSNPYPVPDETLPWSQRFQTEWHAYNAGWNTYFAEVA